jgi:hypothetical protein
VASSADGTRAISAVGHTIRLWDLLGLRSVDGVALDADIGGCTIANDPDGFHVLHLLHETRRPSPPGPVEIDRLFNQAEQARDPAVLIAICGDFTPRATRSPASDLRASGGHRQPSPWPTGAVKYENQVGESTRYSLFHLGRGEMSITCSPPGHCWPAWSTARSTTSTCPISRASSAPT